MKYYIIFVKGQQLVLESLGVKEVNKKKIKGK